MLCALADAFCNVRAEAAASQLLSVFFFSSRRRHTRLQGDWSSDVCSSDLFAFTSVMVGVMMGLIVVAGLWMRSLNFRNTARTVGIGAVIFIAFFVALYAWSEIGRASCRERV